MSVERLIICFLMAFFQSIAATVIIFKQIKDKPFKIKFNCFLLLYIYAVFCFLFITNQLRFITFIIVIALILYFYVGMKNRNVLLYAFNTEAILVISEITSSLMLVLFGINSVDIVNNNFYNLLANVLISLLAIILINISLVKKAINKIIKLFNKNKNLVNYLYLFLLVLYLIVSKNGLEFILKSNYYINLLFIASIILIIVIIIKNELKYEQMNEINKQMLNYVTKYEKIITEQGKVNHEFKNQLMVIRGYAQMNSPKLIEYLDSIVKDSNKAGSSYLISQLNKFPDGGIKGLLYYKLSVIEEEKIKYEINVESGVKTKLNNLSTNMYKNITKILGVLLDNAIDASKNSRNKKIIISVIKEKSKVIFKIYNTYKGKIDLSKVGTGHTTKGKGHGYGLRLVNDIINENKVFAVKSYLEEEYYVSELEIKIQKRKKK